MYRTNLKLNKYDITKITELHQENSLANQGRNVRNSNKFSEETVQTILSEIISTLGIDQPEIAWILIIGVLQTGGSNQKAGNSISYTLNEFTLTSQQLNNIIKKITKNGTNRQLARSIADDIVDISISIDLPGDLHAQMLLEHPDLTNLEKVWCSNFQTQNPNCPDRVREWLVINYKSRFNR